MKNPPPRSVEEIALRAYLLGQSSAEEQKRIEQQLLANSGYFNELTRVEESLTDEYVRGELERHEKDQFDSYFLKSQEHQHDLEFARLLHRYFLRQESAQMPPASMLASKWRVIMEVSLACAAIVLMAVALLLYREVTRLRGGLRTELAQLQAQNAAARQREQSLHGQVKEQLRQLTTLNQQLAELENPGLRGDPDTIALSLSPGLERSASAAGAVTLAPAIRWLRLDLQFQNQDRPYKTYRVELQTVEGTAVWMQDNLKAQPGGDHTKAINIKISAAFLTRSDYLIVLSGNAAPETQEEVATYYLSVARK